MDKDFSVENVAQVAQAFSDTLKRPARVVIGYDYRKNSEDFAGLFARILASNNVEVLLSASACPTPAVSFTIVSEHYDAGIVITASHNPPGYNGVKIKNEYGGSAEKSVTDAVEQWIGKNPVLKKSGPLANLNVRNLNDNYLEFLKKYVRLDAIRQSPWKILVDSMHGVGAKHIEQILSGGRVQVTSIRSERNIQFGGFNPEPIPQNLVPSIDLMKKSGFDLAVVTDGDADRVGAIRPGGEFVSPGILLSLILLHFVEDLKKTGSVVTTVSNTALIYKVAKRLGLKVHETPVGFKYICEIMRRENVLIGGEESGGIGFQNYLYERDGLLSGLLLMEMMAMRKKSFDQILTEVEKEFGKLYYVRKDLDYPNELKAKLFERLSASPPLYFEGQKVMDIKSQDGVKFILEDASWLLFRLSGTEPILRIYSEAASQPSAEALARCGKELAFGLK